MSRGLRWGRFGRSLVGKSSPTASLYFKNSCANWVRDGQVEVVSPTVIATPTTQLIFRHDIRMPADFSRARTVYFIDDYWRRDSNLPLKYQLKSAMVEHRSARYYMPKAQAIVVSTERLAQMAKHEYPDTPVYKIAPFWSEPLANLDHFDRSTLDICYLGAQSHAKDLLLILPAIRMVIAKFPTAHFTLSAGHVLPADLAGHPQVHRIPATGWDAYRREIVMHRFHIALYPLLCGEFNAARSLNKLTEHAIVGAATLCSENWVNGLDRAISVPNSVEKWEEKLCEFAGDRAWQKAVAKANLDAVQVTNSPDAQRDLWKSLLWKK